MAYSNEELNNFYIKAHSTEIPILESFEASKELFFAHKNISEKYDELFKTILEKISNNELTSPIFGKEVENFLKIFVVNRGTYKQREAARRLFINADCVMEQKGIRLIGLSENKESVKELYLHMLIVYKISEIMKLNNAKVKFDNDWNRFYKIYIKP